MFCSATSSDVTQYLYVHSKDADCPVSAFRVCFCELLKTQSSNGSLDCTCFPRPAWSSRSRWGSNSPPQLHSAGYCMLTDCPTGACCFGRLELVSGCVWVELCREFSEVRRDKGGRAKQDSASAHPRSHEKRPDQQQVGAAVKVNQLLSSW